MNRSAKKSESVVLETRVPKQLAERFRREVERRGYISVSDAIRTLVRQFLEEVESEKG